MQPDAAALIWDAHRAVRRIQEFLAGRSLPEYREDVLLRSAVEPQFEIVGEALNRLSHVDPDIAASVADLPRMVAFRNILIHGYVTVDDAIVWDIATTQPHAAIAAFDELLEHGELG